MNTIDFSAFDNPKELRAALKDVGTSDVVNSGWIEPVKRDVAQNVMDSILREDIPRLNIPKGSGDNANQAFLWDCWTLAFPKGWAGVRQITGSCVGAGGGNALFSLAAADVVKRQDRERAVVPFWLFPYGISRMLGGLNDRGDGSWGTPFAEACRRFGHMPADTEGLPKYVTQDGYVWGKETELDWSQGKKIGEKWLSAAKPFLVKSTALCRSTDDVRAALQNYYSITCASDWGGLMNPPIKDGVSLNRHYTTWHHQMSVQGWMDHPRLGELFFIKNQWGASHTKDPATGFSDGFWINKADMQYIVNQNEVFAFSQFDGFPSLEEPLDFSAF